MTAFLYLCGAIIFLCTAHLLRVWRWELFISVYEKPDTRRLIQSLAAGYLVSYVLPFKLGDVVRAWLAGKTMKNGKALGFSSVIVDRYLDIVFVGFLFLALMLAGIGKEKFLDTALFYISFTIAGLVLVGGIFAFSGYTKKCIRWMAGIFNPHIEAALLRFFWALIWCFKDIFQKINKGKLIASTLLMWGSYLISYAFFALSLGGRKAGITWTDVFMQLFSQNGMRESTSFVTLSVEPIIGMYPLFTISYILVPLVLLLACSFAINRVVHEGGEDDSYLKLLPHLNPLERLAFLENYFSNDNRKYVKMYLEINRGISIIRDFSAGSNATTMLCMDGKGTFFRKYAFGQDGDKLYQQIQWIEENKGLLPLPVILRKEKSEGYCFYDMPYNPNAVGLFEYAHSMPVDKTWSIIGNVLETLQKSIYHIHVRKADVQTIDRYIAEKVTRNLDKIKSAKSINSLLAYDTIIINGVAYPNLPYYEKYLSSGYLRRVFAEDSYSVIHGDLTIENIICTRNGEGQDGFYIIDPNTGNIHDSPYLDYGKLLQSIHGGYEFLMAAKGVKVHDNHIDFLFTKSYVYKELHSRIRQYLENHFGQAGVKSIYFHEIVHWLRLMPYKIEKDEQRAMLFYAGMLMVMNDVIRMYGDSRE